ncbi:MAG: FAD binding domain-containing protein [Clostridiales bacterium]|nr:FAD binding domain-containing protein [Clostridiales bacterium]
MSKEYVFPKSVAEAVEILAKNHGKARIISGGTDLMVNLANETVKAEVLVDVTRIEGFNDIEFDNGLVIMHAGITMAEVAAHQRIISGVGALAMAAVSMGSPQIRNAATLAGNIISAQPAADAAVMLAALGAEITVRGQAGVRIIAVEDAYAGLGQSVIDPGAEIVVKITFKELLKHQGSAFVRLAHRKALALPILNVGVMLSVNSGIIEWARIVMAPVDIKPARAMEAECFLAGLAPTEDVFKQAGALAVKYAQPRDSLIRGSAKYRLAVLPSLVARALAESAREIAIKGGRIA